MTRKEQDIYECPGCGEEFFLKIESVVVVQSLNIKSGLIRAQRRGVRHGRRPGFSQILVQAESLGDGGSLLLEEIWELRKAGHSFRKISEILNKGGIKISYGTVANYLKNKDSI